MTEYWVSQGKKWCDYCKIYIANNVTSLRNHEFGQRHKESVAQRLANMRKDGLAKEKEKQQAIKDLERIEAQAKKSYERDVAAAERLAVSTRQLVAQPPEAPGDAPIVPQIPDSISRQSTSANEAQEKDSLRKWTYDEKSGYHFNAATGYYYDVNSGLYYSGILGRWTTQEQTHQASQDAQAGLNIAPLTSTVLKQLAFTKQGPQSSAHRPSNTSIPAAKPTLTKTSSIRSQGSIKQNPTPSKVGRGVASSLEISKRKREEKAGPVSGEEAAALAAREAAKKRIRGREKSLLGLYQAY